MTETWKQLEGQVVNGEFYLRQYLGGSDQSAVFLTELSEPEARKAAIKLVPSDPANAELYLSRLMRAMKLSHPHLMKIYQVGRCQVGQRKQFYIVMECAEEDLSQILPERPLTPGEARQMLEPILDALAYLHGEGFAHGHMKPANILAVDDQIKISSDGLYPLINEPSGVLGKLGAYDSPEAAMGKVSPSGDVWALGILLAEALTQHVPVQGKNEEEVAVPKTLPAPFLEIVRHCLHRDPQQRFTLDDIAMKLKPPSPLPPIQTNASASSEGVVGKRRSMSLWVAVCLLLAGILAIPSLLHRRTTSQQTPSPTTEPQVIHSNPEQSPVVPDETRSPKGLGDESESSGGTTPQPSPSKTDPGMSQPTGGLIKGEVLHQVLPEISQKSRETIQGKLKVNVRVTVDPSGNVTGATLDSPVKSNYFANQAIQAARAWKFAPAKVDGREVSSEWLLRFEFERAATTVFPAEATP